MEYELQDTIINGRGADLFVISSETGRTSYTVVWTNEERSVLFSVSARTEAEAIRMAESVEAWELEE